MKLNENQIRILEHLKELVAEGKPHPADHRPRRADYTLECYEKVMRFEDWIGTAHVAKANIPQETQE